jgi:hypothetical protein
MMKLVRGEEKPKTQNSEKNLGSQKTISKTEEYVANMQAALREERWMLGIKSYPFTYKCPHCGENSLVTNHGKIYVSTFPMGSTKKAVSEGSKKKRVAATKTLLQAEEVY